MIVALLLSSPLSFAGPERLAPPGQSIAAEEGGSAAWVNPANLGFNPGPGLGMWYRQGVTDGDAAFAASTSAGGTALGMLYAYDAETGAPWWGFNSALSLGLPGSFRVGTNITWSLPEGADNNFVSWDFGVGDRPQPRVGARAPHPHQGTPPPQMNGHQF